MKILGPFLRLNENKASSWMIVQTEQGKEPQFYEKSLESDSYYQPLNINDKEIIYAFNVGVEKLLSFSLFENEYYQFIQDKNSNDCRNLKYLDTRVQGSKRNKLSQNVEPNFKNIEFKFSSIPGQENYPFVSETDLESELNHSLNAQNNDMPKTEEVLMSRYSLEALTQERSLSALERNILEQLKGIWFFDELVIPDDEIAAACHEIVTGVSGAHNLGNQARLIRESFYIPAGIVAHFGNDVEINEVMEFIYFLINQVYTQVKEDSLEKKFPTCAYHTVENFKMNQASADESDFDTEVDADDDVDVVIQSVILASISSPNISSIFEIAQSLEDLKSNIYSKIYPGQISCLVKCVEWLLNVCVILDIYCLRWSDVAQEVSKHQKMDGDTKSRYQNKFFSISQKSFDYNIQDLYIEVLWRGRS